jgi:hypothetical protein
LLVLIIALIASPYRQVCLVSLLPLPLFALLSFNVSIDIASMKPPQIANFERYDLTPICQSYDCPHAHPQNASDLFNV